MRTVAIRSYLRQCRNKRYETLSLDGEAVAAVEPDLGIFAEEQQQVLRPLRTLPEQQRTLLALYYDGLTWEEESADLLGKSPATVRSHLRHARKTLKELMASGDV
jgi:RNA polymerase sigma factor (sigma-70 family)